MSVAGEDSVSDADQPGGRSPMSATPRVVPATKRSTLTPDYQRDWPQYFDAVKDQPPRDTCLRAIAACAKDAMPASGTRRAIDIAAGEGRDTRAILASAAHWQVVATDTSTDGLQRLQASLAASPAWLPRVRCAHVAMEDLPAWCGQEAIRTADLINASFALPFCQPERFPDLWSWITRTLVPGGRFAGQFFGDRDEWACVRPKSHFTKQQVLTLLHTFDIEHLEEVEKEGSDAMGGTKWHHVFHVVARKRP